MSGLWINLGMWTMQKLRVTYSRKLSGGLFGSSGGVHYDIDLRICMHHEGKIDRQPVYESVHWLAAYWGSPTIVVARVGFAGSCTSNVVEFRAGIRSV